MAMDEIHLPRRRPGAPQPQRCCTGCGQPFVVAGTRIVWLRGTLHAFDRCAGCRRESGWPATAEEWQRLGFIKRPHMKKMGLGVGLPCSVDIEEETRLDWSDDDSDNERDQPSHGMPFPHRLIGAAFVAGALGLGVLAARWGLVLPPPDDDGGQSEPLRAPT